MDIKVTSINRDGLLYPRFEVSNAERDETPEPTVNLSRSGKGCPCPVTDLQRHNDHAPGFKTLDAYNKYVARVRWYIEFVYKTWLASAHTGRTVDAEPRAI